jgi:hypothetical protein
MTKIMVHHYLNPDYLCQICLNQDSSHIFEDINAGFNRLALEFGI